VGTDHKLLTSRYIDKINWENQVFKQVFKKYNDPYLILEPTTPTVITFEISSTETFYDDWIKCIKF
jgi:hypothetical protein